MDQERRRQRDQQHERGDDQPDHRCPAGLATQFGTPAAGRVEYSLLAGVAVYRRVLPRRSADRRVLPGAPAWRERFRWLAGTAPGRWSGGRGTGWGAERRPTGPCAAGWRAAGSLAARWARSAAGGRGRREAGRAGLGARAGSGRSVPASGARPAGGRCERRLLAGGQVMPTRLARSARPTRGYEPARRGYGPARRGHPARISGATRRTGRHPATRFCPARFWAARFWAARFYPARFRTPRFRTSRFGAFWC
ncbi:MAG: hypothetical protein AUI14_20615 [Actinobacteria bacterium 13_2_20CM_2_71_6]|nr:MAG: hypothetical protein AUI14_20615 [Actinobacteria bacterium 13_2_20CM_2_71_6]